VRDQRVRWTCDRCKAVEEREQNITRSQQPEGWVSLWQVSPVGGSVTDLGSQFHICEQCHADWLAWYAAVPPEGDQP
jgi:hypothetical protein